MKHFLIELGIIIIMAIIFAVVIENKNIVEEVFGFILGGLIWTTMYIGKCIGRSWG